MTNYTSWDRRREVLEREGIRQFQYVLTRRYRENQAQDSISGGQAEKQHQDYCTSRI